MQFSVPGCLIIASVSTVTGILLVGSIIIRIVIGAHAGILLVGSIIVLASIIIHIIIGSTNILILFIQTPGNWCLTGMILFGITGSSGTTLILVLTIGRARIGVITGTRVAGSTETRFSVLHHSFAIIQMLKRLAELL